MLASQDKFWEGKAPSQGLIPRAHSIKYAFLPSEDLGRDHTALLYLITDCVTHFSPNLIAIPPKASVHTVHCFELIL